MTTSSWPVMLVVAVHAIVFHALPRVSRPDILFAVTVPEAFAIGAGRRLIFRYRTIVWSGALTALAILLLLPAPRSGGWLMMGVVSGNLVVALLAWLLAHRSARAHAVAPSTVRVASLAARDTSLPGGSLVATGPFAILGAAALLLYVRRGDVPPGTSNPFGLLAIGAVHVAMMLTMAVTLVGRSRQIAVDGPAAQAEQRFRRVNTFVPMLVAYVGALAMSAIAVESIPGFGITMSAEAGFLWPVLLMIFNLGVMLWMFRVGQGGQRAVADAARRDVRGDATPDQAWKLGGLWYFNPQDSAMWVENRIGLGYTLNLGNWRAWLLMVGMMLVPIVAGQLF